MAADGYIIVEANIDDKKAQQELTKLNKQIHSLEEQLASKKQGRLPLEEKLDVVNRKLEEARKQLSMLQDEQLAVNAAMQPGASPEDFIAAYSDRDRVNAALKQQQAEVNAIEKEWKSADNALKRYDATITGLEGRLNQAKEDAGAIQQRMATANPATKAMSHAMERMQKSTQRFSMRLREVVRSALVFTVISQGAAALREWLGKVVNTNDEAREAIARLRGALLTLAQPLLEVIIPAFTTFVNILARLITYIAQAITMLFGTTYQQAAQAAESLYNEAEAIESVGKAAKESGKSLASFDEINQISSNKGGSGTDASVAVNVPDFSVAESGDEGLLKRILDLVLAIGAGLAAWKISSLLALGALGFLGILLSLLSTILFFQGALDAFKNGTNFENVLTMLIASAGIALGLFSALGPVIGPIAAGISLIVTGLIMLGIGFNDAAQNGANFSNMLLTIGGLLASGLGISLLVGSFIPLLIAAIASVVLALAAGYGHADEIIQGLKDILSGFIDFFAGVFTGDFERTVNGISQIFSGISGIIDAIISTLEDMLVSFLDFIDEKTGGKLTAIIDFLKREISSFFSFIRTAFSGVIVGVQDILTGIVTFISGVFTGNWEKAWNGVVGIFSGISNQIISLFEGVINLIIAGINKVIDAANWVADLVPGLGGFINIPNIPSVELPRVKVPALARGAVIPPNREFLAVLGDQKSGTNIETPLATMVQAFKQALAESGYNGRSEATLVLDREVLGKVVYKLNKAETRRIGVNLTGV